MNQGWKREDRNRRNREEIETRKGACGDEEKGKGVSRVKQGWKRENRDRPSRDEEKRREACRESGEN